MERVGCWDLDFYDFLSESPRLDDTVLVALGDLHERAARNGALHGTPVLEPPSGRPEPPGEPVLPGVVDEGQEPGHVAPVPRTDPGTSPAPTAKPVTLTT